MAATPRCSCAAIAAMGRSYMHRWRAAIATASEHSPDAPQRRIRAGAAAQLRVTTTSRYSPGTTIVPSPERLKRSTSDNRSRVSSACAAGCSAA